MWIENFFNPEDKKIKDSCPICKHCFGKTYLRIERIYYCDECNVILEFFPNEEKPKVTLKKKSSEFHVDYHPFDEDYRLQENRRLPEDEPPQQEGKWYL